MYGSYRGAPCSRFELLEMPKIALRLCGIDATVGSTVRTIFWIVEQTAA
jgi:hypothetical protein